MSGEKVIASDGLEKRLEPILQRVQEKGLSSQEKSQLVTDWFEEQKDNMATDITDLVYLCRLPDEERHLLTYPVIGNWYLHKISVFNPLTPHQEKIFTNLKQMVLKKSLVNSHTEIHDKDSYEYNRRVDEFNALLLEAPEESIPLNTLIEHTHQEIVDNICSFREKNISSIKNLTTDLGHGLFAPSRSFVFLTWHVSTLLEEKAAKPLNKTIMVVDDQSPENWYERLIAVGFKPQVGESGYFKDCESALEALKSAHYDVILSDLDLGPGKMRGEEFAQKAYEIQTKKGIKPLIHLFSDNQEILHEVDLKLRFGDGKSIIYSQPELKTNFNATNFRVLINNYLE